MTTDKCPRDGSDLRRQSHPQDGLVFENERCTKYGCLYETPMRLVVGLRRSVLPELPAWWFR